MKHKKALIDAKRGQVFTKLIKEITACARAGGGNTDTNAALRTSIAKAKEANMPSDNVDRAVKRGTGELPGVTYEQITYEGYGPAGVAILVDTLTDNKNRTTSELRNIFSKKGGNLAGAGSVAWIFQKKGYFLVEKSTIDEDALMSVVLDAGAEDMKVEDDVYEITTPPASFDAVKKVLAEKKIPTKTAELTMIPSSTIKLAGGDAKQILMLVDQLEEHDDVQNVYANFDVPDEVLKEVEGEK
ncbi:MAG: YebC/PmpR family DNA-binding transcriptional regulator [Candidatus Omnitrophota bacterium]